MNRVAIALLVAAGALIALPMFVAEVPVEDPQFTHVPRTERIIDLPEDGDLWQLVIVYTDKHRNDADRQLAAMFASTPRLQSLVAQTKVYEYGPEHFWVKQHFAANPLPAVVLQAVDAAPNQNRARVIYKASWGNFPADGEALASEIQAAIEARHPELVARRLAKNQAADCPNCVPSPARPNDSRRPGNPRIPDLRPRTPGLPGTGDNSLAVLMLLVGAGVAGWLGNRNKPA